MLDFNFKTIFTQKVNLSERKGKGSTTGALSLHTIHTHPFQTDHPVGTAASCGRSVDDVVDRVQEKQKGHQYAISAEQRHALHVSVVQLLVLLVCHCDGVSLRPGETVFRWPETRQHSRNRSAPHCRCSRRAASQSSCLRRRRCAAERPIGTTRRPIDIYTQRLIGPTLLDLKTNMDHGRRWWQCSSQVEYCKGRR